MQSRKIEVYHLMLNDKGNVMTELVSKGPRSVEIIEMMESTGHPQIYKKLKQLFPLVELFRSRTIALHISA